MNARTITIPLLLFAAAALQIAPAGAADCQRTAHTMHRACRADILDDAFVTVANCRNMTDRDARRECIDDAWATRLEDGEECRDVRDARLDACALLHEVRYDPDPLTDPAINFIDPDDVPAVYGENPYVSVAAGHTYVLRAGEEGDELVVVHATGETREILGVSCRVVADIAFEVAEDNGNTEYEVIEATDDLFGQDDIGNVYYCGEVSRNYEDGVLRDLDGSFEAGMEFAKGGVLISAFPVEGDAHRQEFRLGEAEDIVQYLSAMAAPTAEEGGDNEAFPCSPDVCLKTLEFSPLEPDASEFKYYLPGTGFVLAVAMEDGEITGEREELVCVGESLDILSDPSCEIDAPETLAEALCEVSPNAFCD